MPWVAYHCMETNDPGIAYFNPSHFDKEMSGKIYFAHQFYFVIFQMVMQLIHIMLKNRFKFSSWGTIYKSWRTKSD